MSIEITLTETVTVTRSVTLSFTPVVPEVEEESEFGYCLDCGSELVDCCGSVDPTCNRVLCEYCD